MRHVVEEMAARHPDLFARAHREGDPQAWRFNEALAWELYSRHDKRWGMNWKRDGSELSMDVIAFRVGPTDRHVECFDIIEAAGGANPRPGWGDITNYATIGQPGTARWAEPQPSWAAEGGDTGDGGGGGGGGGGGQTGDVAALRAEVAALRESHEALAGHLDQAVASLTHAINTLTEQLRQRVVVEDGRWLWAQNVEDRLVVNGAQVEATVFRLPVSGTAKLSDERKDRPE
jgi:hypothetical protein